MTPSNPPNDPPPLVSLSAARERTINDLSTAFANDDLSMDELESRIERAYKAMTLDEMRAVTADLRMGATLAGRAPVFAAPTGAVAIPPVSTLERDRVVAIMSSSRRRGLWTVPQHLEIVAVMSDTKVDLSRASLPAGIIEINVRAMMASLRIILPPGIRVASRLSNIMSDVSTDDDSDHSPAVVGAPVIRLTGWAVMSDFKIWVRDRDD